MDRRAHSRLLTLKTAKIASNDIAQQIDCAILNMSESGAAILVPRLAVVLREFLLVTDPDGEVRCCSLRWSSGARIGISFRRADGSSMPSTGPEPAERDRDADGSDALATLSSTQKTGQ